MLTGEWRIGWQELIEYRHRLGFLITLKQEVEG